jgi:multidrug efflux pump subunit AcrA (membrane-fusion protein)
MRVSTWTVFVLIGLSGLPTAANELLEQSPPIMLPGEVWGAVVPLYESEISSPISASVEKYHVAEGDQFRAGDLLVSLECSVRNARLEQARVDLEVASRENSAQEELAKTGATGLLELEMSRLAVLQKNASLAVAVAEGNFCNIVAPYDGIVLRHRKNPWEHVNVGEPLIDIADNTKHLIEFLAPSYMVVSLPEKANFIMQIMELSEPVSGEIVFTDPRVDRISGLMRVRGELSGPIDGLIIGMSGQVLFDKPNVSE